MAKLTAVEVDVIPAGKQRVVEAIETLADRAVKGDIIGMVFVTQNADGSWEHGKINLSYTETLAMGARIMHRYNDLWDRGE